MLQFGLVKRKTGECISLTENLLEVWATIYVKMRQAATVDIQVL